MNKHEFTPISELVVSPCIYIDIEASGLHPESTAIEVGWAYFDLSDLSIEPRSDSILIKPEPELLNSKIWWNEQSEEIHGISRNEQSEEIHGISRNELLQSGHDRSFVASVLNKVFGKSRVYSDAESYDTRWMKTVYKDLNIDPTFWIDDFFMSIAMIKNTNHYLQAAEYVEQLGIYNHRAANDALANALVAWYTIKSDQAEV